MAPPTGRLVLFLARSSSIFSSASSSLVRPFGDHLPVATATATAATQSDDVPCVSRAVHQPPLCASVPLGRFRVRPFLCKSSPRSGHVTRIANKTRYNSVQLGTTRRNPIRASREEAADGPMAIECGDVTGPPKPKANVGKKAPIENADNSIQSTWTARRHGGAPFYWVLLGFTKFYCVFLGFYLVLQGFTWFPVVAIGLHRVGVGRKRVGVISSRRARSLAA